MAVNLQRKVGEAKFLTLNDTLTSGITKADYTDGIVKRRGGYRQYGDVNTHTYVSEFDVNTLQHAIAADAAEAFGEHIATFPLGLIRPICAEIKMTSLCPTGLSATAGEIGLGSVIGSGAAATLGTTTLEDIMEGTTIANHVAATTLNSYKANNASLAGGTTATHGVRILDGSATAKKLHLNIASTWNQTAAETFTFSATVRLTWQWVGTGVA